MTRLSPRNLNDKTLGAACHLSILSYGISITIIGPALLGIQQTFCLSEASLGLFTTLLSVGLIASVFSGGIFIDRLSPRLVSIAGQVFLVLGLFLFSMAGVFPVALFSFLLMGIGGGFIEIATNTLIANRHRGKRGAALNLLHAFFGIGAVMGPIVSGFIIERGEEWRLVYAISCIFSVGVLLLLFFSRFPDRVTSETIDLKRAAAFIKNPLMAMLALVTLFYVGSEMGISYWSVLFLETYRGATKLVASSFLSYFWIAITAGRFFCYALAHRIGERALLLLLSFFGFISYGVFLIDSSLVASGISLFLVGLFFSGIFPTILAIGINRFPQSPGTTNGFLMTFMGGGLFIFPYLVGVIAEYSSLRIGMGAIFVFLFALASATGVIRFSKN